jgi:ribosomal protein S12 methylthiotransferase accessory factor
MVERVQDAGYQHFLLIDYTTERVRSAHAVRAIIPGMETTNQFFTGPRARATSLMDLMARGAADTEAD